jgi:hypothetical protein
MDSEKSAVNTERIEAAQLGRWVVEKMERYNYKI